MKEDGTVFNGFSKEDVQQALRDAVVMITLILAVFYAIVHLLKNHFLIIT